MAGERDEDQDQNAIEIQKKIERIDLAIKLLDSFRPSLVFASQQRPSEQKFSMHEQDWTHLTRTLIELLRNE